MMMSVQAYVAEYDVSDASAVEIVEMAARDLYARPLAYGFNDADEINEVFSRYWPRILQAVKNFKFQGASFKTYFIRTMQFLRINCYKSKIRKSNYDYTILKDMANDSCLYAAEGPDMGGRCRAIIKTLLVKQQDKSIVAFRTRLVYLCVKCSLLLSDKEIEVLSTSAKLDIDRVLTCVHTARQIHSTKLADLAVLEEKRNVVWLRLRNLELQYYSAEDETKRKILSQKLAYARKLYRNASKRLEHYRPLLSNREVAELLNVPKPTVDSGLLRLQKMVYKDSTGSKS